MAKTEFKWDSEVVIAEVQEGDKVKHVVKACMLNDVPWVSIQKTVLTKNGWEVKKNQNFKKSVFESVAHIVANVNLYE